jgi:hypothetical protein
MGHGNPLLIPAASASDVISVLFGISSWDADDGYLLKCHRSHRGSTSINCFAMSNAEAKLRFATHGMVVNATGIIKLQMSNDRLATGFQSMRGPKQNMVPLAFCLRDHFGHLMGMFGQLMGIFLDSLHDTCIFFKYDRTVFLVDRAMRSLVGIAPSFRVTSEIQQKTYR